MHFTVTFDGLTEMLTAKIENTPDGTQEATIDIAAKRINGSIAAPLEEWNAIAFMAQ